MTGGIAGVTRGGGPGAVERGGDAGAGVLASVPGVRGVAGHARCRCQPRPAAGRARLVRHRDHPLRILHSQPDADGAALAAHLEVTLMLSTFF